MKEFDQWVGGRRGVLLTSSSPDPGGEEFRAADVGGWLSYLIFYYDTNDGIFEPRGSTMPETSKTSKLRVSCQYEGFLFDSNLSRSEQNAPIVILKYLSNSYPIKLA